MTTISKVHAEAFTFSAGVGPFALTFTGGFVPAIGDRVVILGCYANTSVDLISSAALTGVPSWTKIGWVHTNSGCSAMYGDVTGTSDANLAVTPSATTSAPPTYEVIVLRRDDSGAFTDIAMQSATNASWATPATPSITPTSGLNAYLIAATRHAGTFSSGPTGGFSQIATTATSFEVAEKSVTPSVGASESTSWTWTTAQPADAIIFGFTVAAGGGGGGALFKPFFTGP